VMHSVSLESPETSAYGWVPVLDPIRSREPWPEPIRFGWRAHVRAASDTWDDECTGLGFFSLFFSDLAGSRTLRHLLGQRLAGRDKKCR
jgi:hypothetical protein